MNNHKLDKFLDRRSRLIEELELGRIDKDRFLEENYFLIIQSGIRPFLKIDNLKKGLFNYQYYNAMAKDAIKKSKRTNSQRQICVYRNKAENYYHEKDKATMSIIKLLGKEDMEAYFVESSSHLLDSKLFEIYVNRMPYMVLHSMDDGILNILKEKKVLQSNYRKSRINKYINTSY